VTGRRATPPRSVADVTPAAKKTASSPARKPPAARHAAKPPAKAKHPKDKSVVRKEEPRKLTDPRVVRALAHPVRIALLEALLREGPLTATQAAELLADSPGNMSWHLQTLAKYGYIEEADGGVGRRRPWRLVSMGTQYDENPDDAELSVAVTTLSQLGNERAFDRLRRWTNERGSYPRDWQQAWYSATTLSYLLPDELEQLGIEMHELITRYRDRTAHPERRPKGSLPVSLVAFGHPIQQSPSGN